MKQIGVSHVFCIPGDYLVEWAGTLDDPATNAGPIRVHPNNEMRATYAADGFGRATNQVEAIHHVLSHGADTAESKTSTRVSI